MSQEKTRVDFNAPASLVERADRVAELLGISRTQLLVDALQGELSDLAEDDAFRHRLETGFYEGRVAYDTVEEILGTEDAMRLRLLRDSLDRDPPEPRLEGSLPSDEEFYDGEVPNWTPGGAEQ